MFTLKPLPYNKEALAPIMSAQTLELHHDKHHQAYVDNLNKLIIGTELEELSLEEVVVKTAKDIDKAAIFNNAGQVYNHNIFWESLKPIELSTQPGPKTMMLLETSFGGLENFYNEFKTLALSQFGSGWAWLVKDGEKLKIMKTSNADNPLTSGLKPLLGIDVWEHAYYLDYQNRRADFLEAVLHQLINWQFVEDNL
jgi:Fe-Mn family superoxide dismutase